MNATIQPAPVRKSVTVRTDPAHAFSVFTASIGSWWPPSHHIGTSPMKTSIIEPGVGGRWYSICQDDTQCDIGKVLAWDPPRRLILGWQLDGDFRFAPDIVTEIEVGFSDLGDGSTRVDLEHRHLERFGDQAEAGRVRLDAPNGWGLILSLYAQAANA